jgi:hypothetical protein
MLLPNFTTLAGPLRVGSSPGEKMSHTPRTIKGRPANIVYSTLEQCILRLSFAKWLGLWYSWEMQHSQAPSPLTDLWALVFFTDFVPSSWHWTWVMLQKWCVMLCIHSLVPWRGMTQDHCEYHCTIIVIFVDNRFCQNLSSCGEVSGDGIERFIVWVRIFRFSPCCICCSFLF